MDSYTLTEKESQRIQLLGQSICSILAESFLVKEEKTSRKPFFFSKAVLCTTSFWEVVITNVFCYNAPLLYHLSAPKLQIRLGKQSHRFYFQIIEPFRQLHEGLQLAAGG